MRHLIKEEPDNLKKIKGYEKILQGRIEEIDGRLMLVSDGKNLNQQITFLRNDYLGDTGISLIKLELDTSSEDEREKFLLECFNGMILKLKDKKYPKSVFWFKENHVWCEQDLKTKVIWIDYEHVWSIFETRFHMEYDDIQMFIRNLLEEHFKLGSLTPKRGCFPLMFGLEEHFKLGSLTPFARKGHHQTILEEHFKWGL